LLDYARFLARGKSLEIARAFLRERDEIARRRRVFLATEGGPQAVAFGTDRRMHGFALPKASTLIPGLAWRFTHRLHEGQVTWLIFQPDVREVAGLALEAQLDKLILPGPEELTLRLSATEVHEVACGVMAPHWILPERVGRHIILAGPIPGMTEAWRDCVRHHAGVPFHPSDAEHLTPAVYADLKRSSGAERQEAV